MTAPAAAFCSINVGNIRMTYLPDGNAAVGLPSRKQLQHDVPR